MKSTHLLTLSILSGLLFVCAWPLPPLTPLIFLAWVPLLVIADNEPNRRKFFYYSYLALLIWNAGTTWWIWNSTVPGAIGAIVANALLMSVPLWGFHIFKYKFGNRIGIASFLLFWLSFEYIHLNWQLSWPWLTLGNVFASNPEWVQWYEYTGTSGGSLWILLVNASIYLVIKNWKAENRRVLLQAGIAALIFLIAPFLISFMVHSNSSGVVKVPLATTNVVIIQPNVDPYNEKFDQGSTETQVQRLISLSEQVLDINTRLVVWPETALPASAMQDALAQNPNYQPVFSFVNRHPSLTLETGIETVKSYGSEKVTNTAQKSSDGTYYDAFNASVAVHAGEAFQFYNKSKLVPGVETLPDFLLWLGAIFEKFGGTAGGYGKDKEASVFKTDNNPYVAAPIICYESIYGEYVASYVRKGANILTIITNDGWWANTPGHRQHLNYARLRAIETRKWVARSANTGISAVINEWGDLIETKQWAQTGSLKFSIPVVQGETFFVRNGDVISRMILFLTGALIAFNIVSIIKKRRFALTKKLA